MDNAANNETSCPICTAKRFQLYKLGLVRCEACSLVVSPTIWQPQTNELMEAHWFGENSQQPLSSWISRFENWNNNRTLARLAQSSSPGQRLLEIGVGSGSFLDAARRSGYEVMGCDLSTHICQRIRRTYQIPMHDGHVADLPGENRFDIVVMNHVLEHVNEPIGLLREVGRILSPGGLVHIAVPNVGCWEAALPGWTSYEPYHLAYFTPQTISQVVSKSGLAIERLTTHESFTGWFLAVLRSVLGVNRTGSAVVRSTTAIANYSRTARPKLLEQVYRLTMVCSGAITWPLRMLQEKLECGDEAICIARKPRQTTVLPEGLEGNSVKIVDGNECKADFPSTVSARRWQRPMLG